MHIRIFVTNCAHPTANITDTGIQTGLYRECKKTSSVACEDIIGATSGIINLSYDNFVPGELVYFVLDGYAASVCEFRIEVVKGLDLSVVTPPDATLLKKGAITGQNSIICADLHQPISYTLAEPERDVRFNTSCAPPLNFNPKDSICYLWNIQPATGRYFNKQDSTGTNVDVVFTQPGTYTISANTHFNPFYLGSCANAAAGDIIQWTVTVGAPDTTTLPLISICPNTSYIYQGIQVSRDTTIFDSADPCRVKIQAFKVQRNKENLLTKQFVCPGEAFRFQGIDYFKGTFEVVDLTDCSLVHKFVVEEKPTIEMDSGTKFICSGKEYLFQGKSYNAGNHIVKDASKCDVVHKFKVDTIAISLGMFIDNDTLNCNIKFLTPTHQIH